MTIKEIFIDCFIINMYSGNMDSIEQNNNRIQLNQRTFFIKKKFDSKKNNVYLVTADDQVNANEFVVKVFTDEFKNNAKTEFATINQLSNLGIPVPKLVEYSDGILLLEYIPGNTVLQIIDKMMNDKTSLPDDEDNIELKRIFDLLAQWFADLHFKTWQPKPESKNEQNHLPGCSLLKGDCVLKNFIYDPSTLMIYGVDFEESHFGSPVLELGAICAAILTIKPMFSNMNFKLCEYFIDSYSQYLSQLIHNQLKPIDFNASYLTKKNIAIATADALEKAGAWMHGKSAEKVIEWAKIIKEKKRLEGSGG